MNKSKGFSKLWFLGLLFIAFVTGCARNSDEIPVSADTVPPTVTVTSPTNTSPAVPINRRISVAFSEGMAPLSVSADSFTLKVTGSVNNLPGSINRANTSATFTPTALLTINTSYTVTIKGGTHGGVKDLAGNAMVNDYVFTFTTGSTSDATAPSIILTGATDGATGLLINRASTATFSEPMDPATLASPATSFTVCATAAVKGGPCVTPVVGTVTYLGNTATFTPDSLLTANTWYKSTITTAAMDLAGNALTSGLIPNPWSWQTGGATDTTAPKVTVTTPANLATLVPINSKINATFDEAMSPATMTTANFTVKKTGPPLGPAIAGTVSYDVQHNIATFSPQSNLDPDTSYTVTVSNGAKDLAGNALVVPAVNGLPTPNPWTFRTAATAVPPAPLAINLKSAESFGIAARAGMTSTGVTVVNGDIALYANPSCTDSTTAGAPENCTSKKVWQSVTGMWVNGSIYYAGGPDNAVALQVTTDLNTAWIEGKAKVDTFATGFLSGQLAGKTLLKGVYHEASLNLANGGVCKLDAANDPNAVFIIKVDSSFTDSGTAGAGHSEIQLLNGAQARNVWFVIGLDATIGTGTIWNGNILAGQTLSISGGSRVEGRLLAGATGAGAFTMTTTSPAIITITVPQ